MVTLTGPSTAASDEGALWAAYKSEASIAAREQLFSRYAPFARNIARRHYRERSRGDIELSDLYQLAYAGLLEALDRFDPLKNIPFRPFAAYRISGSVSDGIAKSTEVNEQVAWQRRTRRERLRSLVDDDTENLNTAQAMKRVAEIAVGLALGFMLEGTGLVTHGDGDEANVAQVRDTAYDSLAWKETVTHLHDELLVLPEREQMILRQHYLNGVAFEQIASLLGLSKGRISQLHRSALLVLRTRMGEKGHFRLEQ